jgi:tryptophan-rich sensory protein
VVDDFETYIQFAKINKIVFIPYLAWVSFAAVLNGSIWWLNR